jgi:hypothetical protein
MYKYNKEQKKAQSQHVDIHRNNGDMKRSWEA